MSANPMIAPNVNESRCIVSQPVSFPIALTTCGDVDAWMAIVPRRSVFQVRFSMDFTPAQMPHAQGCRTDSPRNSSIIGSLEAFIGGQRDSVDVRHQLSRRNPC